ncbi:MAG: hypothetical protein OGM67_03955 [Oscillospiraceae bacterium]|nr:MAG: hypothetical protein OGM67_03955 [Oscillospiraceae bacterium]
MAIANITPEEARRAYLREWKKAHPDKVREYNARYWKRRAERMAQERAAESEAKSNDEF